MCGIAGILSCETGNGVTIVRRMVKTLYHRGPDHSGIWTNESAGLTLGHAACPYWIYLLQATSLWFLTVDDM